ncbi:MULTISPECIES: VOC family protein [Brevibacillus]|uniref:VOC family protein n=1 Tax=Brevibacillus invocatus TaxID=173959 RepID=A0A3M8BYX2_9BACL|nr:MULTISPECIES: VOC family protein [Brevibacillus]MDH4616949.1 VOC family protein [Brevibacillus sp. AY1]RNB68601.1 VOC family protein [Brevibacillus invocatus]
MIMNQIGTVFVPVRDIEKAREWYCRILGLPVEGDILFGHLYVVPMTAGSGLVLDSRIFEEETRRNSPLFHFNAVDIQAAYDWMKQNGVELITGIEHDHWFNFKDPDGNVLMVCRC